MITVDRGGHVFDTAKIGRLKNLRQDLLAPGETYKQSIMGSVRLETLRERDTSRVNVRFDQFATPVRWLWSGYPAYIKDGVDGSTSWPLINMSGVDNPETLGLGSGSGVTGKTLKVFKDALLRIYNEHYKWPHAADVTALHADGLPAVPLPMPWNRMRDDNLSDADDYTVTTAASGSREKFDVRDLARVEARFRRAIDDEFLSADRWKELLRLRYNTRGSSEVDQVPFHIGNWDLTVRPRSIPAMDGPSRGQWQSLFDFNVDIRGEPFSANEHMVVTTIMTVRFASITENDCNYLALATDFKTLAADAGIMAAEPLVAVRTKDLQFGTATTSQGFLPFGWQWRTRWNRVGRKVDNRSSFPFMSDAALSTAAKRRDATQVNQAFASQSLDDMVIDLDFDCVSHLPITGPGTGAGQKLPSIEPDRLV